MNVTEILENTDFPGSDITFLYSPDVEHCQQLCTQHPSCLFFTYIRADWTRDNRHFYCYLKTTSSREPIAQNPLRGVSSGFSLKSCSPDPSPCLFQVYQNRDFLGADYRFLFTASYEECQTVCTQDPHCQFFTFLNGDYTPYFVFQVKLSFFEDMSVQGTPESAMSGCQSVKICISSIICSKCCRISTGKHLTGIHSPKCLVPLFLYVDFRGSDIRFELMDDPETCQSTCSADRNCQFYSYVNVTFHNPDYRRRCYLKRVITMPAPPKVNKLYNAVSGFSLKNCKV
uniref:Plasma kallikrein-like n=1 Tax=Echeneis naucrates TaxID=173247 RepID=A0A665TCX0_ECHNA